MGQNLTKIVNLKVHSQVHINVHMPLSKRLRDIYYIQKIDSQSLG